MVSLRAEGEGAKVWANASLTYKLDTRLLIARGCPEEENCACGREPGLS
jgi:hypothetical protein